MKAIPVKQGLAEFVFKGQDSILGFAGHRVSVTTTPLRLESSHSVRGCIPRKLYLQRAWLLAFGQRVLIFPLSCAEESSFANRDSWALPLLKDNIQKRQNHYFHTHKDEHVLKISFDSHEGTWQKLSAVQREKVKKHTFMLSKGIELQMEAKLVFSPKWGGKSGKTRQ